tara:strand:- start:320 stop:652 length:333 start_codon:yes stop_codon:yes gene_type:complete
MASRQKTREVFIELINLQLEPHGKTYADVVNESDWYMKYNTTREKEQEFITNATKILKTKLRMSKSVADKEISWFILQWGLTTNNSEIESVLANDIVSETKKHTKRRTKK